MIRQSMRRLLRSPLSLAAALLAFALGIGVNTAMYSVADAILFRPVDLAHLNRLLVLQTYSRGEPEGLYRISPADFRDFESRVKSFDGMGFASEWEANLTRDGEPEQVSAARVSTNWHALTGAHFAAGRTFAVGEEAPGKNKVAILTEGLARRRFGAAAALGRKVLLDGEEYLVVGLLRDTSRLPNSAAVYVPYVVDNEFAHARSDFRLMAVGRLRPGASREQAQAELDTVQAAIVAAHPRTHARRGHLAAPVNERIAGTDDIAATFTRVLLFGTGFVVLIACANVANLQLARVSGQVREYALHSALGAPRWRIAGMVLTESLLLSLGGAILGCLLAVWAVEGLKYMLPPELWQYIPMWPTVRVNGFALTVTILFSAAAGLLSGLWPAWNSSRADAQEVLREGARGMTSSSGRQWARAAMITLQTTLSLVLLIGAGLMVRGTGAVLDRFAQGHPERIASLQVILPRTKYPEPSQRADFARRLEERLASVPGAEAFGLVNYVPLYENMSLQPVVVQGRPEPPVAERPAVNTLIVTPGYFSTMNVRLMAGRFFTPSDGPAAGAVCVVDQKFVESYFPGEDPLGRQLSSGLGSERTWCRIVGVVEPRDQIVWDREPRRTWYRPVAQMQPRVLSVVLRTGSPMPATLAALKQAVFAVDPEQPVRQLYSQQQLIDNALGGLRLVAVLMTGVGVIALLLSAIGIFSLVSYVVSERTPEIGMRMAMGASSRDILTLVSRQTVVMGSLGLTLGLAIGYALAQSFSRLIWGVSSKDFWSLASVSLLLAIVGATATYIPARRAMRLDPMEALRHD